MNSDTSSELPFRIKICGIRNVTDARCAMEAGADAIGLNFLATSKRYCELESACAIATAYKGSMKIVGLFVNHSVSEIESVCRQVDLDLIQLHGAEPAADYANQFSIPIVRAMRWPASNDDEHCFIEAWSLPNPNVVANLVDANISGAFGGTGEKTDWSSLSPRPTVLRHRPLILAGGLTPQNVEDAILAVRPDGVDTASGVESSPGIKSSKLIQDFVTASTVAFEQLK